MNTAYLALGSNIDPEANLQAALRLLSQASRLRAISSVWETRPVGYLDQANFLNMAVIIDSELAALALKAQVLQGIERALKRVRQANKNGPRTIDLDLVLFNRQILRLGQQRIPDPDILVRPFLAIPLAEIAPDYRHPETGQTLAEIAARFRPEPAEMVLRADLAQPFQEIAGRG